VDYPPRAVGQNLVTQDVGDAKGRTTKETSPTGSVTYTVYLDTLHEVRVYTGWNSTTNTATVPTEVIFKNETLTMAATPAVTSGAPNGSEAISAVQTLTVYETNAAGQVTAGGCVLQPDGRDLRDGRHRHGGHELLPGAIRL